MTGLSAGSRPRETWPNGRITNDGDDDDDDEGGAGVCVKEGVVQCVVPVRQVVERLNVNQHIGGAESEEVDLPERHRVEGDAGAKVTGGEGHGCLPIKPASP